MEIQDSKPHWLLEIDVADSHAAIYLILSASHIQKCNAVLSRICQQLYINNAPWNPFPMLVLSSLFRHRRLCSEPVLQDLKTQFKAVETLFCKCRWLSRLPLWFPLPSPSQKRFVITLLCIGSFFFWSLGPRLEVNVIFLKADFFP